MFVCFLCYCMCVFAGLCPCVGLHGFAPAVCCDCALIAMLKQFKTANLYSAASACPYGEHQVEVGQAGVRGRGGRCRHRRNIKNASVDPDECAHRQAEVLGFSWRHAERHRQSGREGVAPNHVSNFDVSRHAQNFAPAHHWTSKNRRQ